MFNSAPKLNRRRRLPTQIEGQTKRNHSQRKKRDVWTAFFLGFDRPDRGFELFAVTNELHVRSLKVIAGSFSA